MITIHFRLTGRCTSTAFKYSSTRPGLRWTDGAVSGDGKKCAYSEMYSSGDSDRDDGRFSSRWRESSEESTNTSNWYNGLFSRKPPLEQLIFSKHYKVAEKYGQFFGAALGVEIEDFRPFCRFRCTLRAILIYAESVASIFLLSNACLLCPVKVNRSPSSICWSRG